MTVETVATAAAAVTVAATVTVTAVVTVAVVVAARRGRRNANGGGGCDGCDGGGSCDGKEGEQPMEQQQEFSGQAPTQVAIRTYCCRHIAPSPFLSVEFSVDIMFMIYCPQDLSTEGHDEFDFGADSEVDNKEVPVPSSGPGDSVSWPVCMRMCGLFSVCVCLYC